MNAKEKRKRNNTNQKRFQKNKQEKTIMKKRGSQMIIHSTQELMDFCCKHDFYVFKRLDKNRIMLRNGQILKHKEEVYA